MVSCVAPGAKLSQQTEHSSISYEVYMGVSNDMVVAEGDLYQKFLIQQLDENFSWLFTNVTRKVLFNQFFFANNLFFNLSGQYLITKLLLSCLLS
jgi:hypothetical protein